MTAVDAAAATEVACALAAALERGGITYAIGGALAYGVWGVPRGTQDVDLTAFVGLDTLDHVFAVLEGAGCELDRVTAAGFAAKRGLFRTRCQGMRVDVYVPDVPFYDSVRTRVRMVPLRGQQVAVLSAEDLAVFKLLYFRGKDRVDLERLCAVQRGALDRAYVRRWLVEMVGEDDERIRFWDALPDA